MPDPASLDRRLYALDDARRALQAVREVRRDHQDHGHHDGPERAAARALLDDFDAHYSMRSAGRRMHRLAGLWQEIAGNAYWYGMDEYQTVESVLYQSLRRHVTDRSRPTGREIRQLKDSIAEAQVEHDYQNRDAHAAIMQIAVGYNHAVKHPDQPLPAPTPRPAQPLTLKDQADLTWLLLQDRFALVMINTIGGDRTTAAAARMYLPWLDATLTQLQTPLPTSDLEQIAAHWRDRRGRAFNPDTTPDFIMVDPLPRHPSTWWWRRKHGDRPPPPL